MSRSIEQRAATAAHMIAFAHPQHSMSWLEGTIRAEFADLEPPSDGKSLAEARELLRRAQGWMYIGGHTEPAQLDREITDYLKRTDAQ